MEQIKFYKEMGFTLAEFDRTLPSAVNHRPCKRTASGYLVEFESGSLQLYLSQQKLRKIGAISLPYIKVEFAFIDLTQTEVDEIMQFFNLRFQRGGG